MPRIVRFHKTGSADVLQIEEQPLQEPKAGEVRLKVQAIGLNRAEVMFRRGMYLEQPRLPARLGYEASGMVDAIGPGVSGFRVGERDSTIPAFSVNDYGVYGETAIVPASAGSALAAPALPPWRGRAGQGSAGGLSAGWKSSDTPFMQ